MIGLLVGLVIFFYKQNTAYEMRISDCSSDVCSSHLSNTGSPSTWPARTPPFGTSANGTPWARSGPGGTPSECVMGNLLRNASQERPMGAIRAMARKQIGRASCRERVCQYV